MFSRIFRWRSPLVASFVAVHITTAGWGVQPYEPVRPDPLQELWRYQSYPELEGKGAMRLTRTSDGAMWFSTADGVTRYDGLEWVEYTQEDGVSGLPVLSLCPSQDGSLYVGSMNGISRFHEGKWDRVFPLGGDLLWPIEDLIEARDGSIWAGTVLGALHLKRDGVTLWTEEETAELVKNHETNLEISIIPGIADLPHRQPSGVGVALGYKTSQHPTVAVAIEAGGLADVAGMRVGDMIPAAIEIGERDVDSTSAVRQFLLRARDDKTGPTIPLDETAPWQEGEHSYRCPHVYDVYQDRQGGIWLGLWSGEILRYDPHATPAGGGSAWRVYSEQDGLDVGEMPSIYQTRVGTLWTISNDDRSGFNQFDGGSWTSLMPDAVKNPVTTSIIETSDGALLIGGIGRLYVYQDDVWRKHGSFGTPLPSARLQFHATSEGMIWMLGEGQQAVRFASGSARWSSYDGLLYQGETPDGKQWFLEESGRVVRHDGEHWISYGSEDGLIDVPTRLSIMRDGTVLVTGSHGEDAASAQLALGRWARQVYPWFSWCIDARAVYESVSGDLWLGSVSSPEPRAGGVIQLHRSKNADAATEWTHHKPPEVYDAAYGIGESSDGTIWVGAYRGLFGYDGDVWTQPALRELAQNPVECIYTDMERHLWVGTRRNGLFRYNGQVWTQHGVTDGLPSNRILSVSQSRDGRFWIASSKGFSVFDGRTWKSQSILPVIPVDSYEAIRQSGDGSFWFNRSQGGWFRRGAPGSGSAETQEFSLGSFRYTPNRHLPDTRITLNVEDVRYPGYTVLRWAGIDHWRDTPEEDVQYSYRLDGHDWSPYSSDTSKVYLRLHSGDHVFEVRARDHDFNVDPVPATASFVVRWPVWRQPWFILLTSTLTLGVALQTVRVLQRGRRLRAVNEQLETRVTERTSELMEANTSLKREFLERKRVEREHEKLEAQLRQAQKMEAVGQLAGGIAHDFNNLLQAILGYTAFAKAGLAHGEKRYADLEQVTKAAERAATLTRQLLAFSRRQLLQPVDLDLNELIADYVKMLNRVIGEHIELTVRTGSNLPSVRADPSAIEQVLMNLCLNARDAMPGGGQLIIETQSAVLDDGFAAKYPGAKPGNYVLLLVADTGSGMSDVVLEHIFEPFFTTKEVGEGSGLGLSMAYGIIQQHGGIIHCDSQLGGGAKFSIYLPSLGVRSDDAEPRDESSVEGGTETILLAEDEDVVRELATRVLEEHGYRVMHAADGEEAIRLFEANSEAIDLAVLDVVMPSMGGEEAYEHIRRVRPEVPVIFSSGYNVPPSESLQARESGELVPELIEKPYVPNVLLRRVRDVLDSQST